MKKTYLFISRYQVSLTLLFSAIRLWIMGVRVNLSGSEPIGLYALQNDKPVRHGSLVEACIPDPYRKLAFDRGYLKGGGVCGGVDPVLKTVVAVPGDIVDVENAWLSVNGTRIAKTARLFRDSQGRSVPMILPGKRMATGYWLIATSKRNSWDSRYWGEVQREMILGVATPIITWSLR